MADAAARRERLVEVYKQASVCVKCPLSQSRTKVVFGAGNSDAELMFVGEAPGAEEDRTGLPFVGRAGKFLGELLESIDMSRDDVFINNVLLCRPPGNRDPQPEEIEACRPWLDQKIDLIEPKLLTANPTGITKVRGTPQEHVIAGRSLYVLPLFHPAAGLRATGTADQLREDFRLIPELLRRPQPERPPGITGEPADAADPPAPSADQLDIFG